MSAWLVTKRHIDVLVYGMLAHGVINASTRMDLDDLGAMLWTENYRSIRARYGVDEYSRRRPPYWYTPPAEQYRGDAVIYKQARCYRYQSCEHNGWPRSRSSRLTQALIENTARAMGFEDIDAAYDHPDVNKAPWGV